VKARPAGAERQLTRAPRDRGGGWSVLRPVNYGRPCTYRRPPDSYLRLQWIGPLVTRLGLSPRDVVVLEVPGRRSGIIRRTSLVRANSGGNQYLVALAGESEWVRNVRAAGGCAAVGRRERRAVRLVEIPEDLRPDVLRSYVLRWERKPGSRAVAREARYFFGVDPDLSDDQLRAVAPRHPVFRIESVESLIDTFLPGYDLDLVHTSFVHAPSAVALRAALEVDLYRVWSIRALMNLGRLRQRRAKVRAGEGGLDGRRRPGTLRISDLASVGWLLLAEQSDEEIVLGHVGRPWEFLRTSVVSLSDPDDFVAFDRAGFAKVTLGLRVDPHGLDGCLLTVRIRTAFTDDGSRRTFRRYRRFVGPFSALIRWPALRRLSRELSAG
jgi:hypothetical protein